MHGPVGRAFLGPSPSSSRWRGLSTHRCSPFCPCHTPLAPLRWLLLTISILTDGETEALKFKQRAWGPCLHTAELGFEPRHLGALVTANEAPSHVGRGNEGSKVGAAINVRGAREVVSPAPLPEGAMRTCVGGRGASRFRLDMLRARSGLVVANPGGFMYPVGRAGPSTHGPAQGPAFGFSPAASSCEIFSCFSEPFFFFFNG